MPRVVTMTTAAHDTWTHTTCCDRHPSARATHRASKAGGDTLIFCTHCRDAAFDALTDQGFRITEVGQVAQPA